MEREKRDLVQSRRREWMGRGIVVDVAVDVDVDVGVGKEKEIGCCSKRNFDRISHLR